MARGRTTSAQPVRASRSKEQVEEGSRLRPWLLTVAAAGLVVAVAGVFLSGSFESLSDPSTDSQTPGQKAAESFAGASVAARGLVGKGTEESLTAAAILDNHREYDSNATKQFKGESLAYVTPWNRRGYDAAVRFAHKLTFVSPVWLQIKPPSASAQASAPVAFTGEQDIDRAWVGAVRAASNATWIVPRYILEGFKPPQLAALFHPDALPLAARAICEHVQAHGFDGITLELLSQIDSSSLPGAVSLTAAVSQCMPALAGDRGRARVILVLPPAVPAQLVNAFAPHVDRFSVMTYDYSAGRPTGGPNAPLAWVERTIKAMAPKKDDIRAKLLLGLNFYGIDYSRRGAEPVVGLQYVTLLETHRPTLQWLADVAEHVFTYKSQREEHQVYFPSLHSLQARIRAARRLGTGVSVWEIGQGLDYFFDLL